MKTAELQKKKTEELENILSEERGKLQRLKFELPGGKVKNVREIRKTKKSIARLRTLLGQKRQEAYAKT